ncbi:hypothetical protein CBER1_11290 [Cercospora berteroae]|uniref:Histidine-specific methyltransferase SAM-dependent domain-containing protein n=1 Tax=Cercospora berteroae TaxID=357750 RepID=A0A2S6CLD8_9PEZI|nr:hypothetical protein CBER1_11290 [Cercospora berteroae]
MSDLKNTQEVQCSVISDHGDGGIGDLTPGTVIDAGGSNLPFMLRSLLEEKLLWSDDPYSPNGVAQRLLPSPLLSDKEGLALWDRINRSPAYYQTEGEIELFHQYGANIAGYVKAGSVVVDLGCGDVRKVRPFLDILEAQRKPVWYFALDLCHESLTRAMSSVGNVYKYVKCFGLWATFDTGLDFLNRLSLDGPRFFMSLGSIFGNDHYSQAVARLREWKNKALVKPNDAMLLTMDATADPDVIWRSYHDDAGLFEKFIHNGYRQTNEVLGCEWYRDQDWELAGVLKSNPHVHIFVLQAMRDVRCPVLGLNFSKGQQIDCYEAFKYGPNVMRQQFADAGFKEKAFWKAPNCDIYQYLITAPSGETTILRMWMHVAREKLRKLRECFREASRLAQCY